MNIADEEEFSPDKLRANIERLYMTIVSQYSQNTESMLTRLGNRYDCVRQAHSPTAILAGDTTHSLGLLRVLPGLGL